MKIRDFIRKSFKRKLMACFLAVALVPLVLSCACLIRLFQIKLERDNEAQDQMQAASVEQALTGLFDGIEEQMRVLCEDSTVVAAMEQMDVRSKNMVYQALYEQTAALRERAQFDLYSADGICWYSTGSGQIYMDLPPYWGILKVAAAHPDKMIIRGEKEYRTVEGILLRTARAILNEQDECVGFLVASMRDEHFEEALQGTYNSQNGICLMNRFWETVYSTGTAVHDNIGEVLRSRLLEDGEAAATWNDNRIYISRIGDTGLYQAFMRPEAFNKSTVRSMYYVLFWMAVVCLILCVAVAAWTSRNLTKPIMLLNQAMAEVQGGNLDVRIPQGRADELGQLADNFNVMTRELKDYMERQVSQQKKLNDVSIAMMQAQLNPHFLYNTLDTMKWVAKANHIPEIATLASRLAKILRTSISRAQFITLREELQLVEYYMEIQQIRFTGKFHFEYHLPEQLGGCMVPKLVVQPIVENAVIHGMADCDEGHVTVSVSEKDGDLCIQVEDDGCGISREAMEHLEKRDWEQMGGHIGFYNVDMIVRLHYGEEYGLCAQRPEQGGTRVTLRLPADMTGEDKHAEGIGDR